MFLRTHTQIGGSTEMYRRYPVYDATRNLVVLTTFVYETNTDNTDGHPNVIFNMQEYNIQFRSRFSEHGLFEYVITNFIFDTRTIIINWPKRITIFCK